MNYGWFHLGEAVIWVDPELQHIDGETYYQVQCTFKTSRFVGFFKSIDACYESLVHTKTNRPHVSFRDLKFGNSIDIRTDEFSYTDSLHIHAYVEDVDSHRHHSFLNDPPIFDFLSSYVYARNLDLAKLEGPLDLRTFYSNSMYRFRMSPGDEVVHEWNDQEYSSMEFYLEFPQNDLFKKDKKSAVIISQSLNNVPLRVDIDMMIGSFYFKLEEIEYYNE